MRLGDSVIGYYVHHQGRGHLQRARAIGRHLAEPPTMFSSIARPDQVDRWIALPMDNQSSPEDPTASGTLHWVPRHDRGLPGAVGGVVVDSYPPNGNRLSRRPA